MARGRGQPPRPKEASSQQLVRNHSFQYHSRKDLNSVNKIRSFSSRALDETSALTDTFIVALWDPSRGPGQAISGLLTHRNWEMLSVCCLESLSLR